MIATKSSCGRPEGAVPECTSLNPLSKAHTATLTMKPRGGREQNQDEVCTQRCSEDVGVMGDFGTPLRALRADSEDETKLAVQSSGQGKCPCREKLALDRTGVGRRERQRQKVRETDRQADR